MTDSKIHRCPIDDGGLTPCCGRTPFEIPRTDRMTTDGDLVTCFAAIASEALKQAGDEGHD
jgi:hypothetical protein